MPHVDTPNAPLHPYRELLNFVASVPGQEVNRTAVIGTKPQEPSEWGPYFRGRESELRRLVTAALAVENRTQFLPAEIESRVRALEESCRRIHLWQRDAKGDVSGYLHTHIESMWPEWFKVETLALQTEATSKRPAIPGCPGCSSQPAAIDVDDVCPTCGEYFFRCGQVIVPIMAEQGEPEVVRLHAPAWERLPPSKVKKPAISQKKTKSGPLARKTPKKLRHRKSRVAELLLLLLDDRRNANLNCSELANKLECSVSAISRAFSHREYGPRIMRIYQEFGIRPPGIREI